MKKITFLLAMLFATITYAQTTEETMCNGSVTYTKKADGDIRYMATYTDNIAFIAGNITDADKIDYFVSLRYTGGDKPLVKKKGAKIILENGEVIDKPGVEVKIDVNKKAEYEYTAFLKLTEEEAKMLANNKIIKTQVYIMENKVVNPETVQRIFSCIYEHGSK